VKKTALGYIKEWAGEFEASGDSNLGLMGELYDQLRAKSQSCAAHSEHGLTVQTSHLTSQRDQKKLRLVLPLLPISSLTVQAEAQRRREDEELQRVLELSKQDKGGRSTQSQSTPAAAAVSSAQAINSTAAVSRPVYAPPPAEPEPLVDINTTTRVRALYTFTSAEVGELNFEKGDVIKVLDRGFQEWWRGACNGKIGVSSLGLPYRLELTARSSL